MDYIVVEFNAQTVHPPNREEQDILIAWLSQLPFETFEPSEEPQITILKAYMPHAYWTSDEYPAQLNDICTPYGFSWTMHRIEGVNWNREWEKNFSPVRISDQTGIRASFHTPFSDLKYELIIDPKMSFGTGHHATTALMLRMLESIPLAGKQVLDVGCGTGVLAIFAAKAGAGGVLAIENDEGAVENARENILTNDVANIEIKAADAELFSQSNAQQTDSVFNRKIGGQFDVVLANINRGVIIDAMEGLAAALRPGGQLLLSGILETDLELVTKAALEADNHSLGGCKVNRLEGWTALYFCKNR